MGDSNPSASPAGRISADPIRVRSALTVSRAFLIVIASSVGFGAVGAGVGSALGMLAPAYYRSVFASGQEPGFDPVQVGFGLGLSQGLICGVVVGMVVILAVSITRRHRPDEPA